MLTSFNSISMLLSSYQITFSQVNEVYLIVIVNSTSHKTSKRLKIKGCNIISEANNLLNQCLIQNEINYVSCAIIGKLHNATFQQKFRARI